ncbi:hypothetical protein Godav_009788 [Gossypium davidsonii]|uniref:Uncharacterized protein n=1 Tax=Gossypium davidsonii TaxID=34287 RepID=A0A7J8SF20_GOSDV|nr:hypothetical protein [Gossypium davidsonii]
MPFAYRILRRFRISSRLCRIFGITAIMFYFRERKMILKLFRSCAIFLDHKMDIEWAEVEALREGIM